MMSKNKYYAVWAGHNPGIYDSWSKCSEQVKGYAGAIYKGFATRDEAAEALAGDYREYIGRRDNGTARTAIPDSLDDDSIAVDAACSGNPGRMEYRGVHLASRQVLFHVGPIFATNNIGEFLAIVHALALIKRNGWRMKVYSDSRNAILWVKGKKCKTRLPRTQRTEQAYDLIARAERWLADNECDTPVIKWETRQWGEIPADFGRK